MRPLKDIEKEYILAVLDLNVGNQTHTAKQLKISLATVYRKLKLYGAIAEKKVDRDSAFLKQLAR